MNKSINAEIMAAEKIKIYEPLADFLGGSEDEKHFSISLLDVVRFSGHACPSITGAFLICQAAIQNLYPKTVECRRGDLEIDVPGDPLTGPTGPIANVFGFITGAWGETGFGGLNGKFRRKNLLRFNSLPTASTGYRFYRKSADMAVNVFYHPERVPFLPDPNLSFAEQWRLKNFALLAHRNLAIQLEMIRVANK